MLSIILAVISFLIFYRLFREFGKTNIIININGEEKEKFVKMFEEISNSKTQKPIIDATNNTLQRNIEKLREKVPNFTSITFLKKAEEMFDIIFDAFINSKHVTLKMMLAEALYVKFLDQIKKRENYGLKQELSVKHNKTTIGQVRLYKNKASIKVEFDVSQMSAMIRNDGAPIDNPKRIYRDVLHTWIFEKAFCDKDWILSNTSSTEK
jgi:predicted lipid-binding transport protein (Tim44 family)